VLPENYVADFTFMTSLPLASTVFRPASATLILLAAGPLTIWSTVMFLMLLTGVDTGQHGGAAVYVGLLVFSFLGALACRRAINVLRSHPGGDDRRSRRSRAVMLFGIVAVAQLPVTIWNNQSFGDTLSGPVLLILIGGLLTAVGGGVAGVLRRR
jgi:hypothetical protein